jgi:SAM-dependent methyltransferase
MVMDKILGEASDLFDFQLLTDGENAEKKCDLILTLSNQPAVKGYVLSGDLRRLHWTLPFGGAESHFSEELQTCFNELVQTFRSPTTGKTPLSDSSWSRYYQEDNTAWDLGEPSPPFVRLFQAGGLKKGKIAIPGCGKGHEVVYFAGKGFDVTAIDFTDESIRITKERLINSALTAHLIKADFLEISFQYDVSFDTILEQTCYCAIEPVRRADYVQSVCRLLRPSGELIALFYDIDNLDGPPFGTTEEEIRKRFAPYFKLEVLERCEDSHPRRAGKEWLARFRKRDR